jgi:hypothetical protein
MERVGDSVFARLPDMPEIEIFFDSRDRFRVPLLDAHGKVERGRDGKVRAHVVQSFGDTKPTRAVKVG